MLISGFIADAWGWPAIFYVNGITGIAFVIIYAIIGADSPRTSKFISDQERLYIETSLKQIGKPKVRQRIFSKINISSSYLLGLQILLTCLFLILQKLKTPWKAMWTSIPFISLIFVHCAQNWGYWTLMTETPSYMNQMLNVNIKAVCIKTYSIMGITSLIVNLISFSFLLSLPPLCFLIII